jgi:hypothetical protein
MTTRIFVPFEGEDAGAADLTWGQRNIWIPVRRHRSSLAIGGALPLAAGVTVGDVAAQLQFLVGRHQSLRTRVEFDINADREAWQFVSASGQVPLEVVDSDSAGGDPARVAETIRRRFLDTEFDYPSEWPVRWAVVTRFGVPAYLVSIICHLVIDGFGVLAMLAQLLSQGQDRIGLTAGMESRLAALPAAGADRSAAAAGSLEQALWQSSPAGRRVSDSALRHWERVMRGVPARRFSDGADPRAPRFWEARADSPAAYLAVQAIAARLQLGTMPVLLAAHAVGFARATGSDPVVTQVMFSNRFRPGLAGTVSCVTQPGLIAIGVAGITFDQAVTRASRVTMKAAMHSYYDPYGQQELIAMMGDQRGEQMDVRCFFNDRRMLTGSDVMTGPAPSPGQLHDALGRSTLHWEEPTDQSAEPFTVNIEAATDTMIYTAIFDTHYISPARAETCLREMEAILISAAFDPAAPSGIPPA